MFEIAVLIFEILLGFGIVINGADIISDLVLIILKHKTLEPLVLESCLIEFFANTLAVACLAVSGFLLCKVMTFKWIKRWLWKNSCIDIEGLLAECK